MIFSDALPVQFWTTDCDTYNESEYEGVFRRCFCLPVQSDDYVPIQFYDTTGYTRKLRAIDSDGNTLFTNNFTEISSGIYQYSFYPYVQGITDEQIKLQVLDSSNTILRKSDCLNVKESHDETVMINYHNNRIFASLNSGAGTPDPDFNLRIPAVFFKERFPEEHEVLELSNSTSVQLNAQVKAQKMLQIGPMPFYMHRKMKLVLKFQNVTIDNQEWIQEENYEIAETRRTNPLSQASCWLTEKNYVLRNVL